MTEKISAIFFCGDKSRYGAAHISPVLEEFDVKAIVLVDDSVGNSFGDRCTGVPVRTINDAKRT